MIDSCIFKNIVGETIEFNNDPNLSNPATDWILPLRTFEVSGDARKAERTLPQDHGLFGTPTYLGKFTVHMEGDILYNNSAQYNNIRFKMLGIIFHDPFDPATTKQRKLGDMTIGFNGMSETFTTPLGCTVDAYPEIPLQALNPSVSPFLITWVFFRPYFVGTVSGKPYYI